MEFFQKSLDQTKAFLSELSPNTRLLVLSLLVVLGLAAWLVMLHVAEPELVPITRFAPAGEPAVMASLQQAGIEVQADKGQLMVPTEQYDRALAILMSSDLLAADISGAFDEMISHQSPWQSNAQHDRAFQLAKQKALGRVISKMSGVKSASVMLAMPKRQGFGASHVRPGASVNVLMGGRKRVDKSLVEAIAGLVSGAVAEMQPQDVVVIDANRGRQFTVKSKDDLAPGETLELTQQLEQRYREKISEALSYIPGLIVAVNARVDPVLSKHVEEFGYEESEPLKSEFTKETQRQNTRTAGEPGVRSNTGLDIAAGGQTGRTESIAESRNEFREKNLTRRVKTREVGHTTKSINVTVNVPRSYFVGVFQQGKAEEVQAPGDEELQPLVDEQLAKITSQVEPLITTEDGMGVVQVHMIPDRDQLLAAAGLAVVAPQGAVTQILDSPWAKPVGLVGLSLLSLGIMFGMVRKATQRPVMPTVEELAGVPSVLPGEEDLLGEAEASETSMDATELDDDEVRIRKIAEEISEMITGQPEEAVLLLNRWVKRDD